MRRIVGCMTGTSIDGIDAALVEVEGTGLGARARFVHGASAPLGDLAPRLRALASQTPTTALDTAALMTEFSLAHAALVSGLLGTETCDLICVHGQTVAHAPPHSWQLFQAAPLAHALRVPVVYDLRQADLAAGGQGAPITPIADSILYRDVPGPWGVVNLGGFCNVTRATGGQSPDAIQASDVCACNHLLDAIARTLLHRPFDDGGQAALAGHVHHDALLDLEGVLASQRRAGRSLGTGDEVGDWISRWRAHVTPGDLAATACVAIAEAIAAASPGAEHLILAGGGVRNAALTRAIASASTARVTRSDEWGVPAEFREAAGFAVLGGLCQDRVPITLAQVTHRARVAGVSGAWVFP